MNPKAAEGRYSGSDSDANTNTNSKNVPFGNSQSRSGSFSSPEWEGLLPIHIACQIFRNGSSIPIGLFRLLISSYPEGLKQTDGNSRLRLRSRLRSISLGSLPLHLAILAEAPFEAIQLLVHRDPRAIA